MLVDNNLVARGGYRRRDGSIGVEKLLELTPLPDALFAVNEPVALGVFIVLKERGI